MAATAEKECAGTANPARRSNLTKMPGWKTHLLFGLFIGGGLLFLLQNKIGLNLILGIKSTALFFAVVIIGSLFPDLDIRNSKIFGTFVGVATVTIIISLVRGYIYIGIITTLALAVFSFLQHRGILHSFSTLGVTSLIVYSASLKPGFVLLWAGCYLTHLLLDREVKLI